MCSIEMPASRAANSLAMASVAATLACCEPSRRTASSGVTPNCAAYWIASSASASACVCPGCALVFPVIRAAAAAKDQNMNQDLAADRTTFDLTPPTPEQFQTLVADLSDEEKHVLLEHGTEAPFCGVFLNEKRPGVF